MERKELEAMLDVWCEELKQAQLKRFPTLRFSFSYTRGGKYYRIVENDGSAFAFVDFDGNIYKVATWKAPAKGIRGTLFDNPRIKYGEQLYKIKF